MPRAATSRSAPLSRGRSGGLVSAKSKTGDPACSQAMSAWVKGRRGGIVSAAVYAMLGKCRSMARNLKMGAAHRGAGNEAKAQVHEARARRGLNGKQRLELARQKQAGRKTAKAAQIAGKPAARPAAPKAAGWSLDKQSASGHKAFKTHDDGAGKTRFMFDMKKDDLPGQRSMFDPKPGKSTAGLHSTGDRIRKPALKPMTAEQTVRHGRATLEQRSKTAGRLVAARAAGHEQSHPETHGQVGKTYDMAIDKIHFDPDRFQYKLAAQGGHGTTEALKDVKTFNPALAGTISVWKDPADGKTYVVNGHHRLDLANRLNAGTIKATYIDAPNHVEARAHGAMVNIAEGRGTSTDAAKFFRDRKIGPTEAAAEGVSLREHTAQQGLAMAGLHEHAFKRVVSGELKPNRAAIIGGSGLSHDAQHQLLTELDKPKNKNLSDATVQNMVHGAHAAGSRTVQTRDLFGSNEEEQSLFVHRATAESAIKRSLSEDKRLFSLVSKSKAAASLQERGQSHIDTEATGKIGTEAGAVLHLFDELKHRDPHISRPLNEAAERIARGDNPKTVHAEARARITKRIKAILEGDANPFD